MAQSWKTAVDMMSKYYAAKGEEWPGFEANKLLGRPCVDRNRKKYFTKHNREYAEKILQRAAFNVDDLVENHLGFHFAIEKLDYLDGMAGAPVFGVSYPDSNEFIVCERACDYEPLYRTTVLHETGHIFLHKKSNNRCMMFTPECKESGTQEQEANLFMRVALLPRPVLLLAIVYFCHIFDIDIRVALGSANIKKGRWIWRHKLFPNIINTLCVSRQMIALMMLEMGWFSPQTLEYHKQYRLQTRWHTPEAGFRIGMYLPSVLEKLGMPAPAHTNCNIQ